MKGNLERLYSGGIRLDPQAYDYLEKNEVPPAALDRLLSSQEMVVSLETLLSIVSSEEKVPLQTVVSRSPSFKPIAKEYESNCRVIDRSDISGKSNCEGKLENFVSHFRDRFERVSKILRERISPNPVVATSALEGKPGQKVRLIAMVTEKRTTKKGNVLLDVEDEEGVAKVVIMQKTPAFEMARRMLNDDIVAIDGKLTFEGTGPGELFIAEALTYPEVSFGRELKKTEKDIAIAYISDLHMGSKKFLDKEFAKFISWLNGDEGNATLAGKVKYLTVCGDIADGIGIYPEQEKELEVKDIYKQYEMFDRALEKIPDYITVVVTPGNHDAVRRAEPQPMIPYDMITSEVVRAGNPCRVEIEGFRHLMYHGTALDSIIAGISGLTYSEPQEAMLELLKRRHLSPIYGDNLIVPEDHDYLVMEDEPDILHMGHVHKNAIMMYRGTLLINSGTFQDRTDFQVRMGHMPSPGLVTVLETKSGKMNQVNFMGEG